VVVDKGLTIRFNQHNLWYNAIHGDFEGELLHLAAEGIVFGKSETLGGSRQTGRVALPDQRAAARITYGGIGRERPT